jgi:hypothetical protein
VVTTTSEAPFTLLQESGEIVRREAVEATQVPLRLLPEVLHPLDEMPPLVHEGLARVDAPVMKRRDIQHSIRRETICIDDAVRWHLLANDRQQRSRPGIRHNGGKHLPASFEQAPYGHLACRCSATVARATPPKELSSASTSPDKS